MTTDYTKAPARVLESMGVTHDGHAWQVLVHPYETDKDRWTAWLCESLIYGLNERRDPAVVIRCFGQVKEYLGRLGGFYPNGNIHDSAIALQHKCEDLARGKGWPE
jgi:hypothetical protein